MTPSFIQYHYLPSGEVVQPITWVETFLPVMPLYGTAANGALISREKFRPVVRNDGSIILFYEEGTSSAGRVPKWIYSIDGGRSWSNPQVLPLGTWSTAGGGNTGGLISAVATDDNNVYLLSEWQNNVIRVTQVTSDFVVSNIHQSSVSQYTLPGSARPLIQPGGRAYFFMHGSYNYSVVIQIASGSASKVERQFPFSGINGNFQVFSVIDPGGILPSGEIWLMGWGGSSIGRISAYRTYDGGASWQSLGYASHATTAQGIPFGLFRNPDGTRTFVWNRYQSNTFSTYQQKVYWNRHDGDGWLFPTEQSELGNGIDGQEPNLLSPNLNSPTVVGLPANSYFQNAFTQLGFVGDRIAVYYQRWSGATNTSYSTRTYVRFFNDDGTPGALRPAGLSDGLTTTQNGGTEILGAHVSLAGRVTIAQRGQGAPYPHFRTGNDTGMSSALVPSVASAAPSSGYCDIVGPVGSPNRAHEAAFYSVTSSFLSGAYAGDLYVTTSIV